jgi:hypothetical protein
MQRTVSKPSVTWLLLVALLITSGVLTAVRGLGPSNKVVACTGYGYGYGYSYGYQTPAPQLTLTLSKSVAPALTSVTASGTLTQNGCVLAGQTVILKTRWVKNGAGVGSFVTYKTTTTDANGKYSVTAAWAHNINVQAIAPAANGRPEAISPTRVLRLQSRIGASAPVSSHLVKARICGRITQSETGAAISLYRGVAGKWQPIQLKRVLADKSYCFAVQLPKGKTAIKIRVATTQYNLFGERAFYVTRT